MEKPLVKEDLGVFYKGILKPITKEPNTVIESIGTSVTIKTANPSSGLHGLQSILKEVKVMLYLGKHVNIAHLVGCCTENLNQGWNYYHISCTTFYTLVYLACQLHRKDFRTNGILRWRITALLFTE